MKPPMFRRIAWGSLGPALLALWSLTAGLSAAEPSVVQVRFSGPSGLKVWVQKPGTGRFTRDADVTAPGRVNLRQGQTYRLKLADIPNHPGVTLYPTLEIARGNAQSAAFLRNSAISLTFTPEDFEQAAAGRLVTRVISLDGGRETVLAVLRMGNIDLEAGPGGR